MTLPPYFALIIASSSLSETEWSNFLNENEEKLLEKQRKRKWNVLKGKESQDQEENESTPKHHTLTCKRTVYYC